jgi:hypothetical protein
MSSGIHIQNYYRDVLPPRFLTPIPHYRAEAACKIQLNSRLILCGGSSSGKTTALFNIIDNLDCWDTVTIIAKTIQEDLWEWKVDQLEQMKARNEIKWFLVSNNLDDLPPVEHYDSKLRNLVVIDDCGKESKAKRACLTDFYTRSRKFGVFLAYIVQSFYSADKYYRDNSNYIVLLSDLSAKELRRVCGELQSRLASVDETVDLYHDAMQTETDFFLYDRNEKFDRKQKYRRCFGG